MQKVYKQRGAIEIILALLLITALGAAGYFYWQTQQTPSPNTKSDRPAVSTTTTTPDPTANWKTYTNTKYEFSFKHPKNLTQGGNISGPFSGDKEAIIGLMDKSTSSPDTDASFDGLAIYIVRTNKNLNTYIEEEKEAQANSCRVFSVDGSPCKPGTEENIVIGEQNGTILKDYSWDSIERMYISLPETKNILVISKLEQKPGSFNLTFNQILSTFKFID